MVMISNDKDQVNNNRKKADDPDNDGQWKYS